MFTEQPPARLKSQSLLKFDPTDFPSSSSNQTTRRVPKLSNAVVDRVFDDQILLPAQIMSIENEHEFEEDAWADCEEGSDVEEVCTCKNYTDDEERNDYSDDELPSRDVDLTGYTNLESSLTEDILDATLTETPRNHRKRKLTSTLGCDITPGGRKRLALHHSSLSPRLSNQTTPTVVSCN